MGIQKLSKSWPLWQKILMLENKSNAFAAYFNILKLAYTTCNAKVSVAYFSAPKKIRANLEKKSKKNIFHTITFWNNFEQCACQTRWLSCVNDSFNEVKIWDDYVYAYGWIQPDKHQNSEEEKKQHSSEIRGLCLMEMP